MLHGHCPVIIYSWVHGLQLKYQISYRRASFNTSNQNTQLHEYITIPCQKRTHASSHAYNVQNSRSKLLLVPLQAHDCNINDRVPPLYTRLITLLPWKDVFQFLHQSLVAIGNTYVGHVTPSDVVSCWPFFLVVDTQPVLFHLVYVGRLFTTD